MEDKLLTPKEVATILRCCLATVHNKMASGDIRYCDIGGIKRVRESWLMKEIDKKRYEKKGALA